MKRILVVFLLLVSCASVSRADDTAKRAKTEQLLSVMHIDKQMAQVSTMMNKQIEQMFQSSISDQTLTPDQKVILDDYMKKVFKLSTDAMGWDALKPDLVSIYASNFSEEELDGMITFYSSAIGQSALTKMPQMATDMMSVVQKKVATLQPQIKAMAEDMAKQMETAKPAAKSKS